jgi:hypothetical protein
VGQRASVLVRLATGTVACALALPAVASADGLTANILSFFNQDRQVNGLPTVSVVNQAMEQGCFNHDHYMALNHEEVHGEDTRAQSSAAASRRRVWMSSLR